MYYIFRGLKVYYNIIGNGEVLILLHGWGVGSDSFAEIVTKLKHHFQIVTIDFSGFGLSEEPKIPFTLDDYVEELKEIINHLNLENITIVAHSFSGRVAIKYSLNHKIKKLILVDSAGISRRSLKTIFQIYRYKILKHIYRLFSKTKLEKLKQQSGSSDYQKASPVMKQTMSNILRINLKKDLQKISCKTLILWGYYDTVTPLSEGMIFNKYIKNSRLIVFFKSGHFPYLDEKDKFIKVIISGGINV